MKLRVADINLKVDVTDPNTEQICSDFCFNFQKPDLSLTVSPFEVKEELEKSAIPVSFSEAECFLIFKKLSNELAGFSAFLMHGAAISAGDRGIVLMAKSGVGKTTHALLWKQVLGEKFSFVNGDKPIIRFVDNEPIAYGSPWCGKEGFYSVRPSRITDICLIERAEQNRVESVEPAAAVEPILNQVLLPKNSAETLLVLGLVDRMLKSVRVWKIFCNKDISSAELAVKTILDEEEKTV